MCVGSHTAGTWFSSQGRPDGKFETDRPFVAHRPPFIPTIVISAGVIIGFLLAFAAAQLFATLLVGVTPFDPLTFGAVAVILTIVAAVASYVPARRASRLDPLTALRQE
jgi:hypothetical protein